jgi:hypothetical protein
MSPKIPITPEMTVGGDLGQQGDDADIFMQRFFEFFDIDSGDYDFHRYFFMDGEGILYHFIVKYVFRKRHSTEREPLTVGMLRDAMFSGKWDSNSLSLKRS